jgi:nicotinamidase-related amidase
MAGRPLPGRSSSATAAIGGTAMVSVPAKPYDFALQPDKAALLIIDMQRDFIEPGGFGDALGNDVAQLERTIAPLATLLAAARASGLMVMHTREGHKPDLSDLHETKKLRGRGAMTIGDEGPMGRILVIGEPGHDIIPALYPIAGEPVIDKPGKGAFYNTELSELIAGSGLTQLIVCGVTTEVCVHTTVREANDRGIDCLVLSDCTGSYFPEFHEIALRMIAAQGGIFGWVGESTGVIAALTAPAEPATNEARGSAT